MVNYYQFLFEFITDIIFLPTINGLTSSFYCKIIIKMLCLYSLFFK